MSRISTILALVALATIASAEDPKIIWQVTEGISAPESAYWDAESRFLYLSQIRKGGGKAKDGDGGISKLTRDGKMVEENWITGLNAPKGVRSSGGTLYVSDIDELVVIDIKAGKVKEKVQIPDAKFLNDVAAGPDGAAYVSDMAAGRVFRYLNGEVSVFAEGPELQYPNGLLVHDGGLILGGWGTELNPEDFSTKELGQLQRLDLKTKKLTAITPKPLGHIDGIEIDGQGGYVLTDWRNGKVFHVDAHGIANTLLSLPQGTADHAVVLPEGILILPEMLENRLTAYELNLKAN